MTQCERYPGREPGEWVWDVKLLCGDPTCDYHHPEQETPMFADYIIDENGVRQANAVDIEIVTREDGSTKRVLIDGEDMALKIAAGGLTIRPGNLSNRTLVDVTLVAKSVTYRSE